jgi:hypothetical protein
MAIDLDDIFARGGQELIDVLNYCVRSVQMDPVFAFLVGEYRMFPTPAKAIALYDMFIATEAPARINAVELLPPRELSLQTLIRNFRPAMPGSFRAPVQPGKNIFDSLAVYVRQNRRGAIARVKRRYNPTRTPTENLPRGKMTEGQKQFVTAVWEPRVRPTLVAAGFRRVANIA